MPVLTVRTAQGERRIPFEKDRSVREILDGTDLRVRAGCRGMGTCGLCRVRIDAGDAGSAEGNELIMLTGEEVAHGSRLACQVRPREDLSITVLAPAPQSAWRALPEGGGERPGRGPLRVRHLPAGVATPYGVAVDLGTTYLRVSLSDLSRGTWLAGRYGRNPQVSYGSDVITRLLAACDSRQQALAIRQEVVRALAEALMDISLREGIDIGQVVQLSVVGNTAMLALLSGRNYELLLRPAAWEATLDCLPGCTAELAAALGLHPQAVIEVVPPVAGFVGSDLLAGVLTTHLGEGDGASLFIDFGTNSEIALWDGRTVWVTSAAGGPAFEESGISCGAPAERGAIHRVDYRDGAFAVGVLGDGTPHGICGSGMVDFIAGLVEAGLLTAAGRFAAAVPREGFLLARGERDIVLTKRDVDLFQRAKAAIATGVEILLARAGLRLDDLRRLCIGGFFGRFLDVGHAVGIGLLPPLPPGSVELCGGTALAGCEDALLEEGAAERLARLRERTRLVAMGNAPEFEDLFLKNLYLLPMRGE